MSVAFGSPVDGGRVPGGTLVYGETHHPPDSERQQVLEILGFLARRRALTSGSLHRHPSWVGESATKIRDRLYVLLPELSQSSLALPSLRMIRAECEEVLLCGNESDRQQWRRFLARAPRQPSLFWLAVGKLRGVSGAQIAILCVMYGVELEGAITEILPRG